MPDVAIVVVVALILGFSAKSLPVRVSPLLTANESAAELNPGAEAVNVSVTGPFVAKLSLVVALLNKYAPPVPDVVVAAGMLLQPLVQVIVAPTIAGFPETLLLTVPLTDVALPSVNVFCACNPDWLPTAVK